jgi:hypothetical protein
MKLFVSFTPNAERLCVIIKLPLLIIKNTFMKIIKVQNFTAFILMFISLTFLTGCLTSKKMDSFVADQYNGEIPREQKKKKLDITVLSNIPSGSNISTTVQKNSNVLPLIFYWQWDYRHTCNLNPTIGVTNFANAIHSFPNNSLSSKLNGQTLELTVEQIPSAFAIVDKAHVIWVIYAFSWDKIYVEPEVKDLVVSYRLLQNNSTTKAGKISIKNNEENKEIRFFQSWKSATTEYLEDYNADITNMTKTFINKLVEEL